MLDKPNLNFNRNMYLQSSIITKVSAKPKHKPVTKTKFGEYFINYTNGNSNNKLDNSLLDFKSNFNYFNKGKLINNFRQ